MRKLMAVGLLLGACLVLTGCFDVEQSLVLQKDLSGKAGFTMTVDMEPMVFFMAQMQHSMSGKEGTATKEEIEAARKDFLEKKKTDGDKPNLVEDKVKLEKDLPPGIQLLDASMKDDGLKMTVHLLFAFDNVTKLEKIELPDKNGGKGGAKDGEAAPGGGSANPFDQPFSGLTVKDEGKTLLLTSKAVNPAAEQKDKMPEMKPEEQQQIDQMFKGLRIAWKIESPFDVVESNATRRDGHTLYWEYDFKTLSKMTPDQLAQGVRVRFKK
jgi:hypothetical protein